MPVQRRSEPRYPSAGGVSGMPEIPELEAATAALNARPAAG